MTVGQLSDTIEKFRNGGELPRIEALKQRGKVIPNWSEHALNVPYTFDYRVKDLLSAIGRVGFPTEVATSLEPRDYSSDRAAC